MKIAKQCGNARCRTIPSSFYKKLVLNFCVCLDPNMFVNIQVRTLWFGNQNIAITHYKIIWNLKFVVNFCQIFEIKADQSTPFQVLVKRIWNNVCEMKIVFQKSPIYSSWKSSEFYLSFSESKLKLSEINLEIV